MEQLCAILRVTHKRRMASEAKALRTRLGIDEALWAQICEFLTTPQLTKVASYKVYDTPANAFGGNRSTQIAANEPQDEALVAEQRKSDKQANFDLLAAIDELLDKKDVTKLALRKLKLLVEYLQQQEANPPTKRYKCMSQLNKARDLQPMVAEFSRLFPGEQHLRAQAEALRRQRGPHFFRLKLAS